MIRRKTILFSLAALLISFAVMALVGETFLRLVRGAPDNPLALIVQDENNRRVLFPPDQTMTSRSARDGEFEYTAHINRHGYRGRDFPQEKSDGVKRILAIGDSFTFGIGAQEHETFAVLIESGLISAGFPVEVINAGAGHASTVRHWDNLERIHLRYDPDMVMLFFDLTDLRDDWHWERHAVWNKDRTRIERFDLDFYWGKRGLWSTLVHQSALAKYLHDKVVRTFQKLRLLGIGGYLKAKARGKRAKAVIIDSRDEFSDDIIMEYDALLMLRGRRRKKLLDQHWQRTAGYLLKIRDLLAERGIPLVIVMYPHGIYAGPDQWHEGRKTWGFEQGKQYTDYYPFELMERFTNENNIPFINSLPGFLSAPDGEYFFNWDGHMTPAGNAIVARQVLSSRKFLSLITQGAYFE